MAVVSVILRAGKNILAIIMNTNVWLIAALIFLETADGILWISVQPGKFLRALIKKTSALFIA